MKKLQLLQSGEHIWKNTLGCLLCLACAKFYTILGCSPYLSLIFLCRILSQEELILKSLQGHIFYKNNVDKLLLSLESHSTVTILDMETFRKLISTPASLRSMWNNGITEVTVGLWMLTKQFDMTPIMLKYSLTSKTLVSCCEDIIHQHRLDSTSKEVINKMKKNFEVLKTSNSLLSSKRSSMDKSGKTYYYLNITTTENVCELLITFDDDPRREAQLSSILGVEVSLGVSRSGFELTTFCDDPRCLYFSYAMLCNLLGKFEFTVIKIFIYLFS